MCIPVCVCVCARLAHVHVCVLKQYYQACLELIDSTRLKNLLWKYYLQPEASDYNSLHCLTITSHGPTIYTHVPFFTGLQTENPWPRFPPAVSLSLSPLSWLVSGLEGDCWTPQLPVFLQALFMWRGKKSHAHTDSNPQSAALLHTHTLPVVVLIPFPTPHVPLPCSELLRLTSCLSVLASCVRWDEWTYYSQWRSPPWSLPPPPSLAPPPSLFLCLSFFSGQ